MNKPTPHKPLPEVGEEVDRALHNFNEGSKPTAGEPQDATPIAPVQYEPRTYHEIADYSKLQFGQKLILGCIILIVVLSILGYFWEGANPERQELHTAVELLKLVTTTALGFVFAKTQITDRKTGNHDPVP